MEKLKLAESQKSDLVAAVHAAIEEKLFGKPKLATPALADEIFSSHYGLFVTLTSRRELRGCIGLIEGMKPIRDAVKEMALEAAFHDPRFPPLTAAEYPSIQVEISILYPLEEVTDVRTVVVGRDGLVMERGYQRGLLLPQVPVEQEWDRDTFLNQTCRKAGMERVCWENGAKVYRFEAEVFGEKHGG
jgi:AmmeMemoRadiSam system protein A